MTLSEMAAFVCGKVRQSDDAAVAKCKQFLAQRAEMLWNEQLWKDALLEAVVTIGTDGSSSLADSVWIPSRGTLLLPPDVDRILAVRTTERALLPEQREQYFRHDPDTLAQTGTARGYHLLKPVVWEFATATALYAIGSQAVTGVISPDGVRSVNISGTASTSGQLLATALVILALRNGAGALNLRSEPVPDTTPTGSWTLTLDNGFLQYSNIYGSEDGTNWEVIQAALGPVSQFEDVEVTMPGRFLYVARASDVGSIAAAEPVPTGTLSGRFDGYWTFTPYTAPADLLTVAASVNLPLRQRIRLTDLPAEALTLRILFKQKFPGFSDDNDLPPIQNMDNCLMAFAQADMLQRARQYGKAQVVQQEAGLLLQQLVGLETVQQARRARLLPAEGYGDEYQDFGNPLTF